MSRPPDTGRLKDGPMLLSAKLSIDAMFVIG